MYMSNKGQGSGPTLFRYQNKNLLYSKITQPFVTGFVCYHLLVIMWFLFGEVSSFSGCFGMGCVILLWHSLSFPYNYFVCFVLILGSDIRGALTGPLKEYRCPPTAKNHCIIVILIRSQEPYNFSEVHQNFISFS